MPTAPPPRIAVRVAEAPDLELDRRPARILAFGSQVLHGSVGLNAAQRRYEAAEVRLVSVPTILLSVTPHYDSVHHINVAADWIASSLDDLDRIGALGQIGLVTSGYLAVPEQTEPIARWYRGRAPEARPPYILDPTLGDAELGFYTDPGLAQTTLRDLVPIATGITPNLFELAQLSGATLASLSSLASIEAAARSLLGPLTEWIVVTGIRLPPATGPEAAEHIGELVVVPDGPSTVHAHAPIDTAAKGLGDTFTAALATALLSGVGIEAAVDAAATAVRSATHHSRGSHPCP